MFMAELSSSSAVCVSFTGSYYDAPIVPPTNTDMELSGAMSVDMEKHAQNDITRRDVMGG